jgi:hypothetical protein
MKLAVKLELTTDWLRVKHELNKNQQVPLFSRYEAIEGLTITQARPRLA